MALNKSEQLITIKSEAYAMIVLENNYNAWLHSEKVKGNNLVCEYDIATDSSNRFKDYNHIVEALLPNIIINFLHGKEENGYLVTPQCENYLHALNELTKSKLDGIELASKSEFHKKYNKCKGEATDLMLKGRKRKALKLLRTYTGRVDQNENRSGQKCGGWSSNVGDKMRENIKLLKSKEKERMKFQLSYRFAYKKKEELMKPKTDDKVLDDYNDLIECEECYNSLDQSEKESFQAQVGKL